MCLLAIPPPPLSGLPISISNQNPIKIQCISQFLRLTVTGVKPIIDNVEVSVLPMRFNACVF